MSSMETIIFMFSSIILLTIWFLLSCKSFVRCSTRSFASFANVLPSVAIIVPAPGIRLAASNTSAYWSINSHAFSAFGFLSFIAVAICMKNWVMSCLGSEHNHGLNLRIMALLSISSTASSIIFTRDVFPLPHSPYKPMVNEDGKEYCDIVFARLLANSPLFNLSSVDFVIGKSGLINLLPPIMRKHTLCLTDWFMYPYAISYIITRLYNNIMFQHHTHCFWNRIKW